MGWMVRTNPKEEKRMTTFLEENTEEKNRLFLFTSLNIVILDVHS